MTTKTRAFSRTTDPVYSHVLNLVRTTMLLGQSEVDSVKSIAMLTGSHDKVIWLDIAVKKAFRVDILDLRDGLVRNKEDSLER